MWSWRRSGNTSAHSRSSESPSSYLMWYRSAWVLLSLSRLIIVPLKFPCFLNRFDILRPTRSLAFAGGGGVGGGAGVAIWKVS